MSKLTASEKQNLPYKEAHLRGLKEVAARAYGVSLVSESGLYKHTSGGSRRHLSRLDGDENIPSELMRVFAATPTQLSSPARASISLSATGVHAIQPLDAQQADCQRVPELASPRSHPRIFGRNFREPHLIKGNRALPP
ncbi:hypothetical protein, partial [Brucella abortus]|uniref:hypothetical protein n=1 Tax=Brucella abortus TaxID=235 RepID=UPI00202CDEB4